jgi:hypothetical protein
VVLRDVRFEVSQAGLRRTRAEQVRNVHACADSALLSSR